ncbi:MAG: thiamine phosphate synthase [Dehalococcoidales bacterium]|jgi:thiamine-phosphate pyrophosphorylase|nr:thiamine phosphate synthase [Dehalococcoidales bacterium]
MYNKSVLRIIDENLNRLSEGLRVLEEIVRMILNDTALTERLKALRHDLIRADLPFNLRLLDARDSMGDVGSDLKVAGEPAVKDLPLLVIANSRRIQEALRVLEEFSKIPDIPQLDTDRFRQARFEIYELEQKLISRLTRREKAQKIHGLYVIIDTGVLNSRDHLETARQLIAAGVKIIQLRDKTTDKSKLIALAANLQELCRQNDVLFIMNDYLDVALAMKADGLHIGQNDFPLKEARRLLPITSILGVSVTTVEQARHAKEAGADYLGVGSMYPTSSKENARVIGPERLLQIKQAVDLPVVAIGGINKNNVHEVLHAGADSICVISAVLNAPDIYRAARELIEIIEAKK